MRQHDADSMSVLLERSYKGMHVWRGLVRRWAVVVGDLYELVISDSVVYVILAHQDMHCIGVLEELCCAINSKSQSQKVRRRRGASVDK